MLNGKVPLGTGLRRRWRDAVLVPSMETLRQRAANEGLGAGPDLRPGWVLKPVSMDPRGLPGPDTRFWVDDSPTHTEDSSVGQVRTRMCRGRQSKPKVSPGHFRWSGAGPIYSLFFSFPNIRERRRRGPHSLESPRVAEVRFVVGAGTLVHPFSRTQLAQLGEVRLIRTGDAAAREELGRCCSTQTPCRTKS